MVNEPTITCGILALQGDYEKHRQILHLLNCHTRLVFNRENLQRCDGLILPGGESPGAIIDDSDAYPDIDITGQRIDNTVGRPNRFAFDSAIPGVGIIDPFPFQPVEDIV